MREICETGLDFFLFLNRYSSAHISHHYSNKRRVSVNTILPLYSVNQLSSPPLLPLSDGCFLGTLSLLQCIYRNLGFCFLHLMREFIGRKLDFSSFSLTSVIQLLSLHLMFEFLRFQVFARRQSKARKKQEAARGLVLSLQIYIFN